MNFTLRTILNFAAGTICLVASIAIINLLVADSTVLADPTAIQEQETQEETPEQEETPQESEATPGAAGTEENEALAAQDRTESEQEFEVWGHLTGKFVLTGDVPEIPDEEVDKDKATCIINGVVPKDDNLIVSENGELKDVYVMMYFDKSDSPRPEIHPSYEALRQQPAVIDNVECRFVPHAAFVLTGQTLQLKNSDNVGHNCHIVGFANEFNPNLGTGATVEVVLENSEKAPINVSCDIHGWMDGTLLVRDEPYFAVSAADGTFTIANIPEGTWEFQFWHKKTGYMKKLTVEGREVGRKGQIEVTIAKGETVDLGEMTFESEDLK